MIPVMDDCAQIRSCMLDSLFIMINYRRSHRDALVFSVLGLS